MFFVFNRVSHDERVLLFLVAFYSLACFCRTVVVVVDGFSLLLYFVLLLVSFSFVCSALMSLGLVSSVCSLRLSLGFYF